MSIFDDPTIRLLLISFIFGSILAMLMIFLTRLNKKRIYSYLIPAITLLFSGLSFLLSFTVKSQTFMDLALIVIGLMFLGMSIVALLIYALYLYQMKKHKKSNAS